MKRLIFAFSVLMVFASPLPAAETSFKALLVSIEKYDTAPLAFAGQDIEKFSTVLMTRYGCETQSCINNAALGTEAGEDVPRRSVMDKIKKWCEKLVEDDIALLYLAGHGVKDGDGKLYLAMTNFNGKNFDMAAIPLQWIREQFETCEGKSKLLLVDTCFAGAGKNVGFAEQATSAEVSGAFAELPHVATIASCSEDEQSWLWMEKKHSLFTYWLIEAFKGHADTDMVSGDEDRFLTFDELYSYLKANVPVAATYAVGKTQNPVVLNQAAGKDFKLPLHAIKLTDLIEDIAEQIDVQAKMRGFKRIGVPAFTCGNDEKSFDPQYGTLPHWATEKLRRLLTLKALNSYEVANENAIRKSLTADEGVTPDDLGGEKTIGLTIDHKGMKEEITLLASGHMKLFDKTPGVKLDIILKGTEKAQRISQAGGVALLNVRELGMTDVSGKFSISQDTPPQRQSEPGMEPEIGLASAQRVEEVDRLRREQEKPHPMADPSSPFRIRFEVRDIKPANWPDDKPYNVPYRRRDVEIAGNHCYLPLSKKEEYQIKIENNTGGLVFARILVDGLNTLSQKEKVRAKGAYLEATDQEEYVVAPRSSLSDARAWAMQTKGPYQIQGFYDANGKNDTLHRFQIVDADQSVAAHKNYTEQLGTITIAFFKPERKGSRGAGGGKTDADIGTAMGEAEAVRIQPFAGDEVPGEMTAVYNIRYATPEKIKEIIGNQIVDKDDK